MISKNIKLKYNGTVDFKITEFNHNIEQWAIWDVLIVFKFGYATLRINVDTFFFDQSISDIQ